MAIAKSIIFRIKRNWGNSSGYITFDYIYLSYGGVKILLPGYSPSAQQPAGADDFANATIISGAYGSSDRFNSVLHTIENGEPNHLGSENTYQSAWFRWTAPYSGNVCFSTSGNNTSATGNAIAFYTGDIISELNVVSRANQAVDNNTYREFEAVLGQEYKVAVAIDDDGTGGLIPLSWGMFEVYSSNKYYNNCGLYGKRNANYNWISNSSTCDSSDGYVVGSDYVQLVIVLKETIEFDQVALFNRDNDSAIREMEVWYTEREVSQSEGEDSTSPIDGEKLFGFSSDIPISDGSEYLINEIPLNAIYAGFGISSGNILANNGGVSAHVESAFSLNAAFESGLTGNRLQCGLALGAYFTGGDTLAPAKILASLGLSFSGGTEQPITSSVDGNLCLTCLARASLVPSCVLKSAYRLGCKMHAVQQGDNALEATFLLSVKANALSGMTEPCLAQEFQHLKWF